jgi:hypothetical protein
VSRYGHPRYTVDEIMTMNCNGACDRELPCAVCRAKERIRERAPSGTSQRQSAGQGDDNADKEQSSG